MELENAGGDRVTNLPRAVEQQEPFVNNSIYSADRMTHLKIVVVAMIAGVALVGVGISVRLSSDDGDARPSRVIKAGKGMAVPRSRPKPPRQTPQACFLARFSPRRTHSRVYQEVPL